jgi:hypothetical protein
MNRSLDTVSEDDERTSSTDPTEYSDLPEVTPTTRSFGPETIRRKNQANQMLREKLELEKQIKRLQERLNETEQAQAESVSTTRASDSNTRPAPTYQPDTPASPHGLTPRVPHPQDVAYQDALKRGKDQDNEKTIEEMENFKSEAGILSVFSKLAQALNDSNNSNVSTPPHFTGKDDEWETWYSQFRTYLKGKGWLDTFESEGPGTTGFSASINAKIYNKFIILRGKGLSEG